MTGGWAAKGWRGGERARGAGKDQGQGGWRRAGSRAPPRRLEKHGPPVRSRLEKMSQGTRGGEGGPGEPEEGQQEGQEEGQEEGQGKARRREVVEGEPQPSSKSAIQ